MSKLRPRDHAAIFNWVVVGPLENARALESSRPDAREFRWAELRGIDVVHLALLRCVHDGVDPQVLLQPVKGQRNPLTGNIEVSGRTALERTLDGFDWVLGGKLVPSNKIDALTANGVAFEALVIRLAPAYVKRLAYLSKRTTSDLARRWEHAWSRLAEPLRKGAPDLLLLPADNAIRVLGAAAELAMTASHEVFVWMPQ